MSEQSKDFGDVWREQDVSFWDGMWAKHRGSPMTEALVECGAKSNRLIEVGCGAGHMVHQMCARGFSGPYVGFDISRRALVATKTKLDARGLRAALVAESELGALAGAGDGRPRDALLVCADFVGLMGSPIARESTGADHDYLADILISRGVLQHQSHWAPMVVAALHLAPQVAMGIGYTTTGPRHLGGWKRQGHYDVTVSLPLLELEATGMGLELDIRPMPNPKRPKYEEALVTFRWPALEQARGRLRSAGDELRQSRERAEGALAKASQAARELADARAEIERLKALVPTEPPAPTSSTLDPGANGSAS